MNKFATIFTLSSVFCITTTASAQHCANGVCNLPNRPTNVPALRGSTTGYQRPAFRDNTVCRDGQCALPSSNAHGCHCNGQSCNCAPVPQLNYRPESYEPITRNQPQYRQTNFSAPLPPLANQRPDIYRTATINWDTDFRRASEQARRTGRPMLVSVTAEWCGYCTKMKQETFRNNGIIRDIDSSFIAISLDADQNQRLVQQMGVQSLPATLVISPDMRIVDREQGFRSAQQLSSVLRRHLQRAELETNIKVACR